MAGKENNPFDYYSSKVKRINIPIPEYSLFHKVSDEKSIDKKFIGREHISERLKNWLKEDKNYTGSYLVTGYRGMGKSSFVGKVLNDVSAVPSKIVNYLYYVLVILAVCIGVCLEFDWYTQNGKILVGKPISNYLLVLFSVSFFLLFLVVCLSKRQQFILYYKKEALFILEALHRKSWRHWSKIKKLCQDWKSGKIGENIEQVSRNKKYNKLIIKINLGHEVLNERDILSLISKNIYDKFCKYLSEIQAHPVRSCCLLMVATILTIGVDRLFYFTGNVLLPYFPKRLHLAKINEFFNTFQKVADFPWISIVLFILLFILVYYFTNYLFAKLSGISACLEQLQRLNDRIESTINEDGGPNGVVATSIFGVNLDRKRKRSYPIANVREIENELINILDRISEIYVMSPRFIIIFDELDKIDPDTNYAKKEMEIESVPEFEQKASGFPGGVTSRRRKQNVLRLLANMKLFVSSANSKFIFISGRELYDAFLADLSDREFAISSIFNGVIYVESFLTSDGNQKDITSMTESYISAQLIPSQYIKDKFYRHYFKTGEVARVSICFKLYFEYLCDKYGFKDNKPKGASLRQIESVMILLYHFSVYLSHISNGSPKKISVYFEKYVRELIKEKYETDIDNSEQLFVKGDSKSKYILSLGYVDQRKIGFIHYIAFPVVQSIIDNASQYGDKLLVSASFLIDHIYKHHNSGFSWRNLEHTPELLEVYRTPELREFIASIISFMKQTHLSPIISGLYQLKFRKKVSEEISILSKFSEEISAIFNFTLDESLSVKKHYSDLLERYRGAGLNKDGKMDGTSQILGGIHHILADLHLMDEEYTEAIFQYQSSIQTLSKRTLMEGDKRNDLNILVQIRNMLKLGLAYERRKTCNSAYQTYSQLVCMLIDYRYIEEKDLSLSYKQLKTNDWKNREAVLYNSASDDKKEFSREQIPQLMDKLPDDLSYCIKGGDLISEFASQMTPLKSSIIMRLSLFEDIRLVYQALLAKLFVLEKIELGGITLENLNVLESEYIFLHLSTKEKDKFIISSDFFRKLAEILYYKNGFINQQVDNLFTGLYFWGYDVYTDITSFCRLSKDNISSKKYLLKEFVNNVKCEDLNIENSNKLEDGEEVINESKLIREFLRDKEIEKFLNKCVKNNTIKEEDKQINAQFIGRFVESMNFLIDSRHIDKFQKCNRHRKDMLAKSRYLPCYACKYYNRSLKLMMEHYLTCDIEHGKSKAILFYNQLHDKSKLSSLRTNYLSLMGHSLDGLGNVMLSCSCNEDIISEKFLKTLFDTIKERATNKSKRLEFSISLSRLEKSLLYYWDASEAFKMAGDLQETSICLKKILMLLLNYVTIQIQNIQDKNCDSVLHVSCIQKFLIQVKEIIVNRCIRNLYSHYEYTNMAEIQKVRWLFTMQMYDEIPLHYLSLFPDIEEILFVYYQLYLKCIIYFPKRFINMNDVSNKECLSNIYTSNFISSCRVENTVYQRMMALNYKSNLNQSVLNRLVQYLMSDTYSRFNYYNADFSIQFYQFVLKYLNSDSELSIILGPFQNCYSEKLKEINTNGLKSVKTKMWFLEYLINDTMFCLTKILETISPFGRSTLFTNSFIAEVYQSLYEWNQMYEFVYLLYNASDCYNKSEKTKMPYILKKLRKDFCDRSDRDGQPHEEMCYCQKIKFYFEECIRLIRSEYPNRISNTKDNNTDDFNPHSSRFFSSILLNIDKANIHRTINNYLAEMAIKKYRKAKEMHFEGKAYKEMINNMYFLDDDLSNDTCQFDFAIERYKINCDYIDIKIDQLKKTFKDTSVYKIESYLGTSCPERDFNFDDLW